MTVTAVANRGLNLLATAVLGMGGLVFGSVVFQEKDLSDKVDDGGFLIIAAVALAWYLWRGNRYRRTMTPIAVAVAAVLVQVAGVILERDDPKAFGDNIGGLVYYVAAVGLLGFQHRVIGRLN